MDRQGGQAASNGQEPCRTRQEKPRRGSAAEPGARGLAAALGRSLDCHQRVRSAQGSAGSSLKPVRQTPPRPLQKFRSCLRGQRARGWRRGPARGSGARHGRRSWSPSSSLGGRRPAGDSAFGGDGSGARGPRAPAAPSPEGALHNPAREFAPRLHAPRPAAPRRARTAPPVPDSSRGSLPSHPVPEPPGLEGGVDSYRPGPGQSRRLRGPRACVLSGGPGPSRSPSTHQARSQALWGSPLPGPAVPVPLGWGVPPCPRTVPALPGGASKQAACKHGGPSLLFASALPSPIGVSPPPRDRRGRPPSRDPPVTPAPGTPLARVLAPSPRPGSPPGPVAAVTTRTRVLSPHSRCHQRPGARVAAAASSPTLAAGPPPPGPE